MTLTFVVMVVMRMSRAVMRLKFAVMVVMRMSR